MQDDYEVLSEEHKHDVQKWIEALKANNSDSVDSVAISVGYEYERMSENLFKLAEHPHAIKPIIFGHGGIGRDVSIAMIHRLSEQLTQPVHFGMDFAKPEEDKSVVYCIDVETGGRSSIAKTMNKHIVGVCFDYGMISMNRMKEMVEVIILEQERAQNRVRDEFDWLNLCEPAVASPSYPYSYSEPRYNFSEAFVKSHKNPKHHNYKNTKKYEQSKGKHRRRQQRRNWKR